MSFVDLKAEVADLKRRLALSSRKGLLLSQRQRLLDRLVEIRRYLKRKLETL